MRERREWCEWARWVIDVFHCLIVCVRMLCSRCFRPWVTPSQYTLYTVREVACMRQSDDMINKVEHDTSWLTSKHTNLG